DFLLGAGSMMLDSLLNWFRGQTVTIPPMDGALRPNTALDEAPLLLETPQPDNLASDGRAILFSTGAELRVARGDGAGRFDAPISALACSPDGTTAVALDDGGILFRGGAFDEKTLEPAAFGGLACPTALAFAGDGTLFVCQGSAVHRPSDWVVDLMSKGASGSVWRVALAGG